MRSSSCTTNVFLPERRRGEMKAWFCGALLFSAHFVFASDSEMRDFFSGRSVHRISLRLDEAAIKILRTQPRENVRCTVTDATRTWTNVAVHLKGSTGSFRAIDAKPSFTLNFAEPAAEQPFHGIAKLHLNNSVEDESCANEMLGSAVFRGAGVPASRVAHALVELNGRKLGLYVIKEGFTADFIARHFGDARGAFYEPGVGHDIGEALDEKWNTGTKESANLDALAAAIKETDFTRRWQRLNDTLDVEQFATFLALEVLLGHRDGYSLARNNFRVFVNERGPASFLPSGMDQLFGRAPSSLELQFNGNVARAFVEVPAGRELYLRRASELLTNAFNPRDLQSRVDGVGAVLKPVLSRGEYRDWQRAAVQLKAEIAARHDRMAAELRQASRASRDR
jgi:spore coat protein H